jgi:hypothetical protein
MLSSFRRTCPANQHQPHRYTVMRPGVDVLETMLLLVQETRKRLRGLVHLLKITVVNIKNGCVTLGFEADRAFAIYRW